MADPLLSGSSPLTFTVRRETQRVLFLLSHFPPPRLYDPTSDLASSPSPTRSVPLLPPRLGPLSVFLEKPGTVPNTFPVSTLTGPVTEKRSLNGPEQTKPTGVTAEVTESGGEQRPDCHYDRAFLHKSLPDLLQWGDESWEVVEGTRHSSLGSETLNQVGQKSPG